jgi:hypothetical protein
VCASPDDANGNVQRRYQFFRDRRLNQPRDPRCIPCRGDYSINAPGLSEQSDLFRWVSGQHDRLAQNAFVQKFPDGFVKLRFD